jgi:hypothetical protein
MFKGLFYWQNPSGATLLFEQEEEEKKVKTLAL